MRRFDADDVSAEPVKCWNLKRGKGDKKGIVVCEGETAYEWGDPSVGIPNVDVTVKKLLVGKHGVSALVQYKDQEPYEESLGRFSFAGDLEAERINDLEMSADEARYSGEQALQELRDEYVRKYGEDLKVGQRVIEYGSDRRGKIIDVGRDVQVKVKWDKQKIPEVKKPKEVLDEKSWDEFEKKFSEYDDFAERFERDRPFRGPFD